MEKCIFAIYQKDIFVPKEDISTFKSEIKADLEILETEMDAKISAAKLDIIKWLIGSVAVSTVAVITTIIKSAH